MPCLTYSLSKFFRLEEIDPALLKKPLGADEVSLKFLAAPINPSDINIVRSPYPRFASVITALPLNFFLFVIVDF